MGRGISSEQSVNSNELEDEVQCRQECIGNVGSPVVLGGKKPARYFSNQMHNFDGGALTDQAGLQNSESDYRLGQDSERQILGSNVITSLYNLPDPLELFREGLSSCDSSRSKDRQTFNSIKSKLPAADYTKESSDQKIPDNTSERSTETEESDGWGSWKVNQKTSWLTSGPDKNGEVTGASSNSEGCSPSPDTNSVSSWLNESTDSSDSGSEGDSSDSLDYFSLLERLEEDPPLAEIPLTAKEKKLIGEFYEKIEGVHNENVQEREKDKYRNRKDGDTGPINCTKNALERVERLVSDYLPRGVRLNSLCDGREDTVSDSVLKVILDILFNAPVITSAASRNFQLGGSPCTSALDDPDNVKAVVDIVRKLIVNGGRVKLEPHLYDEHERLCGMIEEDMISEFIKEREQIRNKLKSAAYEGIVNKDTQVQKNDLVVDVDNCHFYTKYPQDSTIEVAKAVNGLKKAVNDLKKVTNDLKIEELNFKYYIFHIGESIVRFEEDKDEKRNYTDVLQGSIEMSFATKVGKISIHLYPSSTETEDGETENRGIKVEIDEESKTRFSQLEDEEKKA
ncbi:MAG: hypothetical protein LBJ80_00685 [Rickettsiales bacterium]|jgi:hypothetical protein|nr:hypothetical protein [Rickettsiales bacterium]MDR1260928.1 hypothetical protein [Rickettsiales bacterium]